MTDTTTNEPILQLQGDHFWLDNFYRCYLFGGWTTVEHLFQAAKAKTPSEHDKILRAETPGDAKWLGRRTPLRSDWHEVRLDVMETLLREKFSDPTLSKMLVATGDRHIEEGNTWNDKFWGTDQFTREGENHLGRLLMKLRTEWQVRLG